MNLLVHKDTDSEVTDYLKHPSHALLLSGPEGSGKPTLAFYICRQLLGLEEKRLASYPYFMHIKPDDRSIGIETVRELQQFLRLKTASDLPISRIIVIEDAEAMTREAQNAILKILEEPPMGTIIIMTTSRLQDLLPTVRSRAASLHIKPVSQGDVTTYFVSQGHDENEVLRAYHLSEGNVGLLSALLQNKTEHPLALMINNVKQLLAADQFNRLTLAQKIITDKDDLSLALIAMQKIARAGLQSASKNGNAKAISRWTKLLARILKAQESALANPSVKLMVTDIMLNA